VAAITTDLAAGVHQVHVREGDWVAEGDLLIELADAEVNLQLQQRRADLAQARAQRQGLETEARMLATALAQVRSMHEIGAARLDRHRALKARELISQSLLDEVQAQADQAHIQLQTHAHLLAEMPHRLQAQAAQIDKAAALVSQAELDAAKTRINAPFAGPILGVQVAPGDRTGTGVTLLRIAAADSYEIRLQVPASQGERFQRHLEQGQPIAAHLPGHGALTLTRISGHVRPGQSGLDVFFELPATPGQRPPAIGRIVDLRIELPPEQEVVALPPSALYENNRIYAVETRRLEAIEVERIGENQGVNGDTRVLVRSPHLTGGRSVITTQLPKAASGLLVDPG
jgi:multidrug resistance efflux pump